MEPRNDRLYNESIRAVSPSISDWSPMVLPSSNNRGSPLEEYNDGDASFPLIRRSFAFDEWDDNDDDENSPDSFHNRRDDDDDDGTRYGTKTLVGIPSVINGRTIYDATGGPFPFEHHHIPKSENPIKLAPLETYMTVIHLDDTQMIRNNNAFCTSTSTRSFEASSDEGKKMDNFLRFSNTKCPPIFRNSTTYRWTTMGGHSFQNVHAADESSEPELDKSPCLPFQSFDREDLDNKFSNSSSSAAVSDMRFPIPEYIFICMNE